MADTDGIALLKNVILANFAKARSLRLGPSTPLTAPVSSQVTRHDHHNIEVKTLSELGSVPSVVETDVYFFVPRSFELKSFDKAELARDFRSRMRLSMPVAGEQGELAFEESLKALKDRLNTLEAAIRWGDAIPDATHPLCDDVLDATRDLAAIVAGVLKHASLEHTREFFLSHTVFTTETAAIDGLSQLEDNAETLARKIERVRQTATSQENVPQAIFSIFDEYVSQLYVQYLGTLRAEVDRIVKPDGVPALNYQMARARLQTTLDRIQTEEANYRLKLGTIQMEESELERERRLVRLSHLKKFFQSKSFVDVTRKAPAKRLSESSAAAGAAMAGVIAAMVERYSRPEVVDAAFQGLFVICAGVIIFVLRDRLKDWAKTHLHQTATKFLPDFTQVLLANDKKIGVVKEWFKLKTSKELPEEIVALRKRASSHELEKRLPEDALHFRKVQELEAAFQLQQKNWSQSLLGQKAMIKGDVTSTRTLHENTRINVERYLKHMDDPFKELTELDLEGKFCQSLSHRVYHFYLCIKTVSRPAESRLVKHLQSIGASATPKRVQSLLYRVVLDKNGIVRLEDLM